MWSHKYDFDSKLLLPRGLENVAWICSKEICFMLITMDGLYASMDQAKTFFQISDLKVFRHNVFQQMLVQQLVSSCRTITADWGHNDKEFAITGFCKSVKLSMKILALISEFVDITKKNHITAGMMSSLLFWQPNLSLTTNLCAEISLHTETTPDNHNTIWWRLSSKQQLWNLCLQLQSRLMMLNNGYNVISGCKIYINKHK